MAGIRSKTLAPLLILRILEEYSDEAHPITREEIERILADEYGITMERKAFFRHIEHLKGLEDVDIRRVTVKPKNVEKNACAGFYLADRAFSELELRMIIDALSGSHYLSQWETEDLVNRLARLSTRHFQKKMASYQFVSRGNKTENEMLMLALEIIDEAIAEHKQIRFSLLRTGSDGKKVLSNYCNETCTPVRFFVKEHHYYLVAICSHNDKPTMISYKLSDMAQVEITDLPAEDVHSIPEFKHGINWQKFLREHPALDNLNGKPTLCTFLCYRWMIDELKSHFGDELRIRVRHLSDEERKAISGNILGAAKNWLVEVSVITDPYAAMQFAWHHPEDIWLVSPDHAVNALCRRLEKQQRFYAFWKEKSANPHAK